MSGTYRDHMDTGIMLVALTAGMVAAFNPCGFALLPAYLALFLGDQRGARSGSSVARALVVGAAVTAGFIVTFGVAGVLISAFTVQVAAWTPYLTIVVGPLLALLGLWLLSGRELSVRLPRWSRATDSGLVGMFTYGVIYATVSLSCTIPVFLVAVVGTFRADTLVAGVSVLLAYALGMGLVLTALAVALALAKDGLVRQSRRVLPMLNRVSGVLLVLAGVYVTWYGYVEIRILNGDLISRGPVDTVALWSGQVSTFVEANRAALAWTAVGLVGAGVLWVVWRKARASDPPEGDVVVTAQATDQSEPEQRVRTK
jgi:cytochrome c biogenesis protein CcdA